MNSVSASMCKIVNSTNSLINRECRFVSIFDSQNIQAIDCENVTIINLKNQTITGLRDVVIIGKDHYDPENT